MSNQTSNYNSDAHTSWLLSNLNENAKWLNLRYSVEFYSATNEMPKQLHLICRRLNEGDIMGTYGVSDLQQVLASIDWGNRVISYKSGVEFRESTNSNTGSGTLAKRSNDNHDNLNMQNESSSASEQEKITISARKGELQASSQADDEEIIIDSAQVSSTNTQTKADSPRDLASRKKPPDGGIWQAMVDKLVPRPWGFWNYAGVGFFVLMGLFIVFDLPIILSHYLK